MTVGDDLDKLRAAATAAVERAAKAEAAAHRAAADAAARRDARLREHDEKTLNAFDPAALEAEVDALLHAVETAILTGGGVYVAWLDYQVGHRDWWHRVSEANAAAARLGRPGISRLPPSVNEDLASVVRNTVAQEARRRADDLAQERYTARERYADGR